VALNCVANGRILRESPFRDIWIQPAAGDAGGAPGAALVAWHGYHEMPRKATAPDTMAGSYLGPSYSPAEIRSQLDRSGAVYTEIGDAELFAKLAEVLEQETVVGLLAAANVSNLAYCSSGRTR